MTITSLQHVNIRTSDLDGTKRFYMDVVGLEDGARPAFKFPGAWLYCGGEAVIHLIGEAAGSRPADEGTGSIDHVAFGASGWDAFIGKLESKGVAFEKRQVPGGELRQIFIHDPNGVKVELNFRTDEG